VLRYILDEIMYRRIIAEINFAEMGVNVILSRFDQLELVTVSCIVSIQLYRWQININI